MGESPVTDTVAELSRLMNQAQAARSRHKKVQLGLTLALVGVFAAFVAALYSRVETMYTAENFEVAIGPELEQLQPQVAATIERVVTTAAPHYVEQGRERLEAVLPQVRDQLGAEMVGLADGLAHHAEERAAVALERVRVSQEERLRDHYPDLDDAELERLRRKWAGEIQADTTEVLGEFHERVMTDFVTLSNTIESFGPSKYDEFERDELLRYYAHLWLTLVDEEILTGGYDG